MANSAQKRLDAISKQLGAAAATSYADAPVFETKSSPKADDAFLPPVQQVAPALTVPRAKDKVVIVTGANSLLGIGRASAYEFAHAGARAIYLCDAVDDHLAAQQRDLQARCPAVDVHLRCFDAADEAAVKAVVADALRQYARLDVFFANAGIVGPQVAFGDVDAAAFMQTLRVNTLGPFLAAKHAAPAMQQTSPAKPAPGGSIVLTASVAGLRSNAGATPYSASKAAVVSLAQTLAFQLAGSGIRINAVCPGIVETAMTAPTFAAARARGTIARVGQLNPTRRAAHSDEVARVVLFLASDEASYVNGQAWAVDGGLSAGHPFVPGKLS
ncbi:3-oxoacyl-(acyl-carrier-protein) reductase [Grosmannia clavigera kw1407]|uniref:3-oxoacyl-(Acyl-carrier-protein) reductase n=1 Tax=Grosmannia clavigera (strain kw1407 / UAMH 11150) TaxID=655863 RepID=F0X6S2_GROCL|nr:3-oxoacyl-(acyl-carrier-protein) reductase [Grosmannia clavigera kw1407]EFX06543.1 3-oxoacyl-(acyl-carrier-protein) reductase [Grosmannia clavigera kw1407]